MIFLPVKPLGPIEHVLEGKNKRFKYCRPEFYDVKTEIFRFGHEIFR